jgi:AraC family L-rhamnose operon transcriptional activator RhaR/AraC family L-rhamnose operon regulatory protein RhaS
MEVTLRAREHMPDLRLPLTVLRYHVHADVPLHGHDFHELVLVVGGRAIHRTGGRSTPAEPVAAGDVIVLAPDERHGFTASRKLVVYNILFTATLLERSAPRLKAVPGLADLLFTEPLFRREGGRRPRLRLDPTTLAGCVTTCAQIEHEAARRLPGYELAAQGLLDHLLVQLARAWQQAGDRRDAGLAAAQDVAVAAALACMEERLDDEALQVADIAAAAGLSPHWFSEVFARCTGVSPWQWLTAVRVERAKRLLRETATPVTRIALDVGFGDPSYFARVFRAQTGLTPRAWRAGGKS